MNVDGGYFRKILWVDLTSGESSILNFGDEFAMKYIGGRGFGIKLLWDHLRKVGFTIDPLSPENLIVIAPGPLSGLYLPASGKMSFVSLSPATKGYADSNMGGSFGVELRQAGYDALAITGRAESLSYLWIDDDEVKVEDSAHRSGRREPRELRLCQLRLEPQRGPHRHGGGSRLKEYQGNRNTRLAGPSRE